MLTYDLQAGEQPKYYRLYTCIREDILRAELLPGQKLPSKRALAEHLHISLATVSGAYEQLVDEGYLTAKPRSGYYVSAISRLPQKTQPQARLRMLPADAPAAQEPAGYGFRYSALTRLMREVIADCGTRLLEKPPHYGCAELRNAIAEYLLRYRGMLAQPECIVVGSGAEYLYGLIVQLLGRERVYGLEDPGYEKIRQVYAANGAVCELLPMGEDGIRAGALAQTVAHDAHNLFVVGTDDRDMVLAANTLVECGGGLVAVRDGKILGLVPLPIAGLMSDRPLEETEEKVLALENAWKELGCTLPSPFMTMAIIPLACLPEVRLTNRGLVDCRTFRFLDLIQK